MEIYEEEYYYHITDNYNCCCCSDRNQRAKKRRFLNPMTEQWVTDPIVAPYIKFNNGQKLSFEFGNILKEVKFLLLNARFMGFKDLIDRSELIKSKYGEFEETIQECQAIIAGYDTVVVPDIRFCL